MNKIKLIIFDLDGVLIESKKLHEIAFREALILNQIDIPYNHAIYEGLPTLEKLERLGIPLDRHQAIFDAKQSATLSNLEKGIIYNKDIVNIFKSLKIRNIKLAIGSNAIRRFVDATTKLIGINSYIDLSLSNEDITKCKPDPEIYTRIVQYFNIDTKETLIFEDSRVGLTAAYASGCRVGYIHDPSYLTYNKINNLLETYSC